MALAAGPKPAKGSEMPATAARVKNLFQEGFVGPDTRTEEEQRQHRNRDLHDRLVAKRFARGTLLRIRAAGADAASAVGRIPDSPSASVTLPKK